MFLEGGFLLNLTQRTIRISLASLFSIIAATYVGLQNPMSAGIIALLSVLDTRLETIKTGAQRIGSTILAFIIATIIFLIFGFSVYSFGLYLAFYVPLAYELNLEAGISPCSVLVTHFVIAESVSVGWQLNGLGLMVIGVGFALLFNSWMPSYDLKLDEKIRSIEKKMSYVLLLLEKKLTLEYSSLEHIEDELKALCAEIDEFEELALLEYENNYFTKSIKDYYINYAQMRKQQHDILSRILNLLPFVISNTEDNRFLAGIFGQTALQLDEKNSGADLLQEIEALFEFFRVSELPKSRKEFESRAILYYILTDFENFLLLKHDFIVNTENNIRLKK